MSFIAGGLETFDVLLRTGNRLVVVQEDHRTIIVDLQLSLLVNLGALRSVGRLAAFGEKFVKLGVGTEGVVGTGVRLQQTADGEVGIGHGRDPTQFEHVVLLFLQAVQISAPLQNLDLGSSKSRS